MAGVWALVGVVLCLATHTHGQLGEGVDVGAGEDGPDSREEEGVGGQAENESPSDSSQDGGDVDGADGNKDDEISDDSSDDGGVAMSVRWKAVEETYQGCYKEDYSFNDTGGVMFINLTQVMLLHNLSSVEAGCFHMCHVTEPFTHYLSVSLGIDTSRDADSCGCHLKEHLQLSNKVSDDSNCDKEPNLYRIYCGPWNKECYNRGSSSVVLSASSLLTSLLITLLASHVSQLDVR